MESLTLTTRQLHKICAMILWIEKQHKTPAGDVRIRVSAVDGKSIETYTETMDGVPYLADINAEGEYVSFGSGSGNPKLK